MSGQSFATAVAHHQAGRLQQAEALYLTMLDNPDALNLLGVIATQCGQHELAIERIEHAIRARPDNPAYYCNLGCAYRSLRKLDQAEENFRLSLARNPDYAAAHINLGSTLKDLKRWDEALAQYQTALALTPDSVELHANLGALLQDLGRLDEAVACYRQALLRNPRFVWGHFNLGNALHAQGKLHEAQACFQTALACQPDFFRAYNNLGLVFKDQGKLDDAIDCFRKTLAHDADSLEAHSNLLFCYNYHPTLSADEIYSAYQAWNRTQAEKFSHHAAPFFNLLDQNKRLRIGYVSADFHEHSVMRFAGPVIEQHDKSQVEVFCYANRERHDAYTQRMVAAADHWVPVHGMSDDDMAQRIRDDGIDVLIDLSGHTLGNRLPVFARKPAPVQCSWLGFGYTTGLTTMDYFIGDPVFTPTGCEALFSEAVHRLPHCFAVYQPPVLAPAVGSLPALKNGMITFACLSRTERLNARVIEVWSRILHRMPHARLRLDSKYISDEFLCHDIAAQFAAHGVAPEQLQMGFTAPVWNVYQEVDIVLDCFPHNSGTTTYEALWMGVPVVTLAERPSVGRIGASILTCIGKTAWIADDADDYVARAVALAENVDALANTRASLRQAMQASPLLDQKSFVRDMEAAYRAMWQNWCKAE